MIFKKKIKNPEIYPDEIFMDSKNIPSFDTYQFEGRIEKPIGKKSFIVLSAIFLLFGGIFLAKIFSLQILNGSAFAERSENNTLETAAIAPNRGVIYDRNGEKLAWNEIGSRSYSSLAGLGHALGYVGLPSQKDIENEGAEYQSIIGKEGIEKMYERILGGEPGIKILETDAQGNIVSESVQSAPKKGDDVKLSIDARVQNKLFSAIKSMAEERGFKGGAGVILDINTGEVLSLASYPEYDSNIISKGSPAEKINEFLQDGKRPFLNRAISGLYAPGSIIKPIIAIGALNEGTVSAEKQIFSSGSISIPNPYFPGQYTIFKDWQAHGWVDMRRALAVSSDVYFYEIGGGYGDVRGLGIKRIAEYAKIFGFQSKTGIDLLGEQEGFVPTAEWKAQNKEDPVWRIGDTYHASIGQGAFQVTPVQMAVYAGALATNGKLAVPRLLLSKSGDSIPIRGQINIPGDYFKIVKEGMRQGVLEGTVSVLNIESVKIAAKTGTAELGTTKSRVNSWVIGFFPYDNPKYAFSIVMESGPVSNLVGSASVARQLFDWMSIYASEYLK